MTLPILQHQFVSTLRKFCVPVAICRAVSKEATTLDDFSWEKKSSHGGCGYEPTQLCHLLARTRGELGVPILRVEQKAAQRTPIGRQYVFSYHPWTEYGSGYRSERME
jgi:hypothetical protein